MESVDWKLNEIWLLSTEVAETGEILNAFFLSVFIAKVSPW